MQTGRVVRYLALASLVACAFGPRAVAVASQPAPQTSDVQTIEQLRARAQDRMRQDRDALTIEQLREIESIYQAANRDPRSPASRILFMQLVEKYPTSNRAGCGLLYAARSATGDERERLLQQAIASHSDAFYGDGTQVGAYARMLLAAYYADNARRDQAAALAEQVVREYPGAVEHRGLPLEAELRRLKLLP